jgi:hypothetical protein
MNFKGPVAQELHFSKQDLKFLKLLCSLREFVGDCKRSAIWLLCFISDALQQGASQFEQQAGKLKRKFWLQNLKVRKTDVHV